MAKRWVSREAPWAIKAKGEAALVPTLGEGILGSSPPLKTSLIQEILLELALLTRPKWRNRRARAQL